MSTGKTTERNPLFLFLRHLGRGDRTVLPHLIPRLANRLLFVPILKLHRGKQMIVETVIADYQGIRVVPVFTSERWYRAWLKNQGKSEDTISFLGSELCTALDPSLSVLIDYGAPHQVVIEPQLVDEIAVYGLGDDGFESGASSAYQFSKMVCRTASGSYRVQLRRQTNPNIDRQALLARLNSGRD